MVKYLQIQNSEFVQIIIVTKTKHKNPLINIIKSHTFYVKNLGKIKYTVLDLPQCRKHSLSTAGARFYTVLTSRLCMVLNVYFPRVLNWISSTQTVFSSRQVYSTGTPLCNILDTAGELINREMLIGNIFFLIFTT